MPTHGHPDQLKNPLLRNFHISVSYYKDHTVQLEMFTLDPVTRRYIPTLLKTYTEPFVGCKQAATFLQKAVFLATDILDDMRLEDVQPKPEDLE